MNASSKSRLTLRYLLIGCLALPTGLHAAFHAASVLDCQGTPGGKVRAQIVLSNAADVASMQCQLNYDPNLLRYCGATNPAGSLGSAFSLTSTDLLGVVTLRLVRDQSLTSGTGLVAEVTFDVNRGAEPGMECPLVLATLGLGRQHGVDLRWTEVLDTRPARFSVPLTTQSGGGGSLIPSWWSALYGLDAAADADLDSDRDGLSDLQEYAIGSNPTNALSRYPDLKYERSASGDLADFAISPTATGRLYRIYACTNLVSDPQTWAPYGDEQAGNGATLLFRTTNDVPVRIYRTSIRLP